GRPRRRTSTPPRPRRSAAVRSPGDRSGQHPRSPSCERVARRTAL
ncbi:MAG: hypothetical protein AVDCRST_MAG48-857, partial [uncultured Friedmanniella sp.]